MPLHDGAIDRIRVQLEDIGRGRRVDILIIGMLSDEQHARICAVRRSRRLPEVESKELVYLGRHHYESRVAQGYCIADLLLQLAAATAADADVHAVGKMTSLKSRRERDDGHGCRVRDMAILELTARKPRVEIFSVIPVGDGRSPKTTKPR
jgi:hypothetical protein